MADCKIVSVTAKEPVVSIPNGAIEANAVAKELVTNLAPVSIASTVPEVCVNNTITGIGEDWIPDPTLFRFIPDNTKLNEQLKKTIFKVLFDSKSIVDTNFKSFRKSVLDSINTSDNFSRIWNIVRIYSETARTSELRSVYAHKVINDSFSKFEQLTYRVDKRIIDSAQISDLTTMKIFVSSGKFETVSTSEVFSRVVTYLRTFTDQVDATDDFFGEAVIDDDQYALVQKRLLTFTNAVESFGVYFNKAPLYETVNKSDEISLNPKLNKFEQIGVIESQPLFDLSLYKPEIVTSIETIGKVFEKAPFEDIATNTDTVFNHLFKELSDSITSYDEVLVTRYKGENDTSIFEDVINFILETTVSDQIVNSDFIDLSVSKTVDDNIEFSETLFKKDLSIFFNETDYFLSDYFLEDYFGKAVHLSDSITSFVLTKIIEDIVDATDDFYGNLNVDDDQYVTVHKQLVDWTSTTDVFNRQVNYFRSFTSQTSNLDVLNFSTVKSVNDTNTTTEVVSSNVARVSSDIADAQDITSFDIRSYLADVSVQTDLFSRIVQYFRTFIDNAVTSELKSFNVSKVLTDSTNSTDNATKVVDKRVNDTTTTSKTVTAYKQDYYLSDYIAPGYFGTIYNL